VIIDGSFLLLHYVVIKFEDVLEELFGSVFKMEKLVWEDVEVIWRKTV
jgi:hypothetical protein